jgi:hypothetical protein
METLDSLQMLDVDPVGRACASKATELSSHGATGWLELQLPLHTMGHIDGHPTCIHIILLPTFSPSSRRPRLSPIDPTRPRTDACHLG